MTIIFDNNGTPEPYSISQLKADNPNVSFRKGYPDVQINPYGAYRVQPVTKPEPTATHRAVEGSPVFNVSVWEQSWDMVAFNADELEAIQDSADAQLIRADSQVKALILASPSGIENYIDTNVTDMGSAKEVLKILAKAISAIGKRQFR